MGSHVMLASAYNVTKAEIEVITERFIRNTEVLREFGMQQCVILSVTVQRIWRGY